MKLRVIPLILPLLFSVSCASTGTETLIENADLRRAVEARMDYLENLYHIKFDRGEFKGAFFGIPREWEKKLLGKNILGTYIPGRQSIYISEDFIPRMKSARSSAGEKAFSEDQEWSYDREFVTLLDHELGHVYADQVSRRIGNGSWPPATRTWGKHCGMSTMSEGIGQFFGYFPIDGGKKGMESFPEKMSIFGWYRNYGSNRRNVFPIGGYALVAPILERFGQKGLEYLLTHPVDFKGGRMREIATEYLKKAFKELEKEGP